MSLRADGVLAMGIEDHKVSVATDGDRSLSRIEPKQLRRSRGCQFDEAVRAEAAARNSPRVNQAHAMLHSRAAVGNLREIVSAQLFLLLEAEGTVIGRNYLQVIAFQSV